VVQVAVETLVKAVLRILAAAAAAFHRVAAKLAQADLE
jgi:hypothetical protein